MRRDKREVAEKALVKLKIAAVEEFEIFLYSPKEKKFSSVVSRASANPKLQDVTTPSFWKHDLV